MKYINREYGFSGRPPHFPDFYEETAKGPIISQDNYPVKNIIGAGLDPKEPYGAMLIGQGGSKWGIKISCNIRGRWIDSDNFLKDIGRLYAVSREGNFSYFAYGDMTASVVKYSRNALVMSIATIDSIKIRITFYLVPPTEGEIRSSDNIIKGAASFLAVIPGTVKLEDQKSVFHDRYEVIGDARSKEYFTAKLYKTPSDIKSDHYSTTYEYDLQGKDSRLFIYAAIGDKNIFNEYPEEAELIEGTSTEEIIYSTNKTIGRGVLGRSANGFFNSSLYQKIYNPYLKGPMYVESRAAINKFYAFNGTDLNTASVIASYIGDNDTAKSQLPLALDDDILSPLSVWIVFSRTRDKDLLKKHYRELSKKYIPRSELTISKDKSEVAYCMPGSPLKEINNSKPMYSLDKSSLTLLNMDIMERISLIVGAPESTLYAAAKERLKEKINDLLWNPKLGIYMNRYINGDFAGTYGITSFYPLIAGAVQGLDKLEKLISALRDKKKFYGERMIPTLSKDHPEYGVKFISDNGETIMPYRGYRGMIVPYMNFLIYQGLIRYGVYDLASEIAVKSSRMWNQRFRKGKYEVLSNYLPGRTLKVDTVNYKLDTEKIYDDTDRHSLSGNLLALIGLSELIDIEYFIDDLTVALRFGTFSGGEHSVSGMNILGRMFSVNLSDRETNVSVNNLVVISGDGGKFLIRHFVEKEDGAEFIILSDSDIRLRLALPILGICKEATSMTLTVEGGTNKVKIVNGKPEITRIC